jgi:hypothetical protein
MTLALYGVIFDKDPLPRAESIAKTFVTNHTPDALRWMADEIELELTQPTQSVRDALGCVAPEDKCREFLQAFVAHLRRALEDDSL